MDNQSKPPSKNQQNSFSHQNNTSNNIISSIVKSHISKSNSKEYEEKTSQLLKRINCLYQNKILSNLLKKEQNSSISNEMELNEQVIFNNKLSSTNNNSALYYNKNLYSDRGENKDIIIKRKMAKYAGTKTINQGNNKKTKKYIKKAKTNKSVEIEGTFKRNNTKCEECSNNLNNSNINNLNCANNLCVEDVNNINNNYIKIHNARRNNTNVNKNLSFAKPKKKVIYLAIDTNNNEHKNHISNLNSHLSSNLNSNLNSNMNSHINSISNSKGHTKINITDSFHYPKRNIIYNNLAINKNNNSFNYELEQNNRDNYNFEQGLVSNQTPYEKLSPNSLVNNDNIELPGNKDDQNSELNGDCSNDYNIECNNDYNNELNDSKEKPIKVSIKKSRSFVKSKTVENTVNNTQGNENSNINVGHNYMNPKQNNKYKLSSNNSTTNFKLSSLYENKRCCKPKSSNYCIPKPSRSIPKNKKSRIISNLKNNFAKRKNRLNSIEVTNIDKGLELNISQELCEVNPNYANMKKKEINSFIYLVRKAILKYLMKSLLSAKSTLYNEATFSERQKNYNNYEHAKNRYDDADAEEKQCDNQVNNGFVYNQNFTRKNSSSSSMKNLRNSKINIYLNSISNITENLKKINKTILYPNGNIINNSHNAGITDRKNRNGEDRSIDIINNNSFYNGNPNLCDYDKGKINLNNNLNINPNSNCNNKNEKIIKIKRNSFINKSKNKKDEINLTFLDEQKNYQMVNKKMLSSDKCNESIKNNLINNKINDIKNSPITQRSSNTKNNTNQNTINKLNSNSNKTKNNIYPKKVLNEKPKSIIQKYIKGHKNNSCEKSNYQKTNQAIIKNKNSRNSNKSTIFKGKNKSFQITSSRTKSPSNRKELVVPSKNLKGNNTNGKRIESCPNENDNISINSKKKNDKTYVSNNSKDDGAFSSKSSEVNSKNKSKNKGMVSDNSKSCLDSRKDTNLNNNANNAVIENNNSHVIEYYEDYKNVNSFKNTKDNSTLEENKVLNAHNNNDVSPFLIKKQIEKYDRKIDEGDNKLKSKDNSKNNTLTNKSIHATSNVNSININYNKKNMKRKNVNKKEVGKANNNELNIKFDSHPEMKSLKKNTTGHSHSKNQQVMFKNNPNLNVKDETLNNTVKSPLEINDLFNRIYQLIDTNNSTNTNTNPYIQAHKILNSEGELYNDLCFKAKISMDNEGNTEGDSNYNFINIGNNCNSNNKNYNKLQGGNNIYEMNLTSRPCIDHEHENNNINNNDLENEVYSHEYNKSSPLELKQCMAMAYKNGYEKKHKSSIHNNSIINRSFKKTIFDGGETDACFRKGKNLKGKKNVEKDISFQSSNGNKIYEMLLKNKNNLNGKKNTSKNLKYDKEGINSYSGNNDVSTLDKNNEYKDINDSLNRLKNVNNEVKQIESSLLVFIKKIKS